MLSSLLPLRSCFSDSLPLFQISDLLCSNTQLIHLFSVLSVPCVKAARSPFTSVMADPITFRMAARSHRLPALSSRSPSNSPFSFLSSHISLYNCQYVLRLITLPCTIRTTGSRDQEPRSSDGVWDHLTDGLRRNDCRR
jgi:hypothetical protein